MASLIHHIAHRSVRRIYLLILICAWMLIFILGTAQAGDKNFVFKHISVEDGLSQSSVTSLVQDKKGFMWLGTGNGLNKYDGYNFTVYTKDPFDSSSISDNVISALFVDGSGCLWVGTTDGVLNRLDRKSEGFTHYRVCTKKNLPPIPGNFYKYPIIFSRNNDCTITSIVEEGSRYLWVGTWGHGLYKFDKITGKTTGNFFHDKNDSLSLGFNRIRQLYKDHAGRIWIATFGGGLDLIVRGKDKPENLKFIHYKHEERSPIGLTNNVITSVFEDKYNNMWIGTFGGGLNYFVNEGDDAENGKIHIKNLRHKHGDSRSLSNDIVMSVMGDSSGAIWVGTFGGGLNKYNGSTKIFYHYVHDPFNSNSVSDDKIISLYEDHSGLVWIGTFLGKGISVLERNVKKFNTIRGNPAVSNSLNDNVVWSVIEDSKGLLWIGTNSGGLNSYNRKTGLFHHYKYDRNNNYSISSDHVRVIREDRAGNLLIGTYSNGLNYFERKSGRFIRFKHDPNDPRSIAANQIQSILMDNDGTVWVGTFGGGLSSFSGRNIVTSENIKFTTLRNDPDNDNSLSDNRVYVVYKDSKDELWIGTFGGLNKYDKRTGKYTRYLHDPNNPGSLSNNRILSIYEDRHGILWIGTYGGGLNKFDRSTGKFEKFSDSIGVKFNIAYGILEDRGGALWISTDNGLLKYDPQSGRFDHFNLHDGLQSMEFSGGAYYKSKSGEMFFGGINGLNYFYPDSVRSNAHIPAVAITAIKIFNSKLRGEKDILTLSHENNFFTFEFASLDFTNPEDNHFAYKMEGLDQSWHFCDANQRFASYTNLNPGGYKFLVRGSNNDGVWNERGASVDIIILPPFWKTWWFITLAVIFLGGAVLYFLTMRIKGLIVIERLKTKLSADLHDNVGSGLTEISILSEMAVSEAGNISEGALHKLKTISDRSRELVDSMSDIVWVVNPKRDSLHDLIIRLKDSYSDFLSYIGVSFKTSNVELLDNIKLSMEFKQNLYLIFKEGINNSVKHSGCKRIMLEAQVRGNVLEMTLSDDGIGLGTEHDSLGNGLGSIKNRAEAIGGKVAWISAPDKGTSLHFIGRIGSGRVNRKWLNVRIKGKKKV